MKPNIPNVSEIFHSDGTLNTSATKHGLEAYFKAHGEGSAKISNGKASQTTNSDGSVDISISFTRTESSK